MHNGVISALAINGSTVYAVGSFSTIGGQTRNRIAALDVTTGLATAWDPNASNTVTTIAINGSTVYAGGSFGSIGGQTRNRIAALDVDYRTGYCMEPECQQYCYYNSNKWQYGVCRRKLLLL